MKRKAVFLFLMLVFCVMYSYAERISVEQAAKVARNYVRAIPKFDALSAVQLTHTAVGTVRQGQLRKSGSDEVYYYVFNVNNDQGFIIVAGDDVAVPVLGYSDNGKYDENNLPPNFAYWMDFLSKEIASAIENNARQSSETKAQWEIYSNDAAPLLKAGDVVVGPLVQTKWNQGSPYNNYCPNGSYTGCVATAMAQIMKYHTTPTTRTVTIPGYTTMTNKRSIPAITGSTSYDWDNMTNTYSGSSTQLQKDAVAKLMYECGVSVEMDYTTSSSGAYSFDVGIALVNYFGYDPSVQIKSREYYSNADWENLIKKELDDGRPVYYSGRSNNSGHAFVCAGYKDNGEYYFNWGWGGLYDGYFVTTSLNPGTDGVGAGEGTYNLGQEIIINIKPNAGGVASSGIHLWSKTSLVLSKPTVDKGEPFTVNAPVINFGLFDFTGRAGIALIDNDDRIISIIGVKENLSLLPGYGYNSSYIINCIVPSTIDAGNYRLRAIVQSDNSEEWTIVTGTPGFTDILNITITDQTEPDNSNLVVYNDPAFVIDPNPIVQNSGVSITFGLYNNNGALFFGDIELSLCDLSGNVVEIIETRLVSVPNDNSYHPYTFMSPNISSPGGEYKLTVFQKSVTGDRKKVGIYGGGSENSRNEIDVTVIKSVALTLAKGRNWYLSSPVTNAKVNKAFAAANFVEYYDEPRTEQYSASEQIIDGWVNIAGGEDTLVPGKGYVVHANAGEGDVTYTFTGIPNTGDVEVPLTRTTDVAKEGFNLVGNPYLSHIDWDAVSSENGSLVEPTIWYRTKTDAYQFYTYNSESQLSDPDNLEYMLQYIPPMQGFWVRAANTDTFKFTADAIVNNVAGNTNMLKEQTIGGARPLVRLQLTDGRKTDRAVIFADKNAKDGFDRYDSGKMFSSGAAIYTVAENEKLIFNGLSAISAGTEIPLGFSTDHSGEYSIAAIAVQDFNGFEAILKDNSLNTEFSLAGGEAYRFSSGITDNTSRFSVIFRAPKDVADDNGEVIVYASGNTLYVRSSVPVKRVRVYNLDGKLSRDTKESVIYNVSSGACIVKVETENGTVSRKVIVN
ncbi:thiol protease/hemagglutinin PrtT [Dysgonomonas reticulitermitis]